MLHRGASRLDARALPETQSSALGNWRQFFHLENAPALSSETRCLEVRALFTATATTVPTSATTALSSAAAPSRLMRPEVFAPVA
jgi:hypothetical protein